MAMTPRERVLAAMKQEKLDRPPVAVFTQSATIDQMDALNIYWPEAHSNAKMMCELGAAQATPRFNREPRFRNHDGARQGQRVGRCSQPHR